MRAAVSGAGARPRWSPRRALALLGLLGLTVLGCALLPPGAAQTLLALAAGLAGGLLIARPAGRLPLSPDAHTTQAVVQDIQTLQQAFDLLRRQVDATIRTSEDAVMAMMGRLSRVHGQTGALRGRIQQAVDRSRLLSSESFARAGEHGRAVASLAEHQGALEQAQRHNLQRVSAVADQVRQLTPLADLIGGIARQTNLLSINASIEAARAGRDGEGFKVVAAEVRRLSAMTSDAARRITQGIGAAAEAIDAATQAVGHAQDSGAAAQLGDIGEHIQTMGRTLGEVLPYLEQLSGQMDEGMSHVTLDIIDTLGDMQFQDINRQLLQQINDALVSLSDHFAQIYLLIDGQAPPPPLQLKELLQRWAPLPDGGAAGSPSPRSAASPAAADPAVKLDLANAHGPRIEFF